MHLVLILTLPVSITELRCNKYGENAMAHRYIKYMEKFAKTVQQEKDRLAKLPKTKHMILIPDNDATEQEIEDLLHGELDEDDM